MSFKEKLWNKIIVKNKPSREQCFLATAFQRASEGQFFVSPACDTGILDELVKDGIVGYELLVTSLHMIYTRNGH
ncbi:hypothetical protein LNQ52_07210 [Klebsiella pneumoniae subsp. pneumoniae]|nr:hypothetical protein [Klebsiella pneumoniae subsp. pneumoniae]